MTDAEALEALRRIYEDSYARLVRVAEAITREPEAARDAVQEAFARLLRSRGQFRWEGSLEGWVWRAVVNAALNTRRAVPNVPLDPSREAAANGHVPDERLRAVLLSLPERQRLALFLRYYADLDYRGIADALGIRTGTVGATLNQAHAAVRRLVEEVTP